MSNNLVKLETGNVIWIKYGMGQRAEGLEQKAKEQLSVAAKHRPH